MNEIDSFGFTRQKTAKPPSVPHPARALLETCHKRLAMQLLDTRTESLSKRLETLIAEIERSAKMAKMVSMNASVIAVRSRTDSSEAFAFEAVASQIMDISEASLNRIEGLREILREMDSLTSIINKAGRQRMLSQRYMKLALAAKLSGDQTSSDEQSALKQLFESSLRELQSCPLNTPSITGQLQQAQTSWDSFIASIEENDFEAATQKNETVLTEMNKAVVLYEKLVHNK
ncbi:type IV pili methyl-accepting chemotaxis transducer N-terminal domain-containing protein [Pelagicoccus sp. SDUM812005]|uniref:type IV pili methyl-accepting chemotaxis transducer N-terminal domain-containing protein n=1 Tax=Pelagicoccus sp. SDUM812005 TaxID=3041257 RepID=UPI00280D39EC|nr:type IV pili methyl-accepting chemotaxis transducer N-terminal domain-containing protein [Pelagicoccus sp. SDUM812005]MDQ8181363.1 type IV pili methyl-accepting chemotaxis transducer N-terminal domain-containing protein [Pelagicoccus sp. SDUM812005]